MKRKKKATDRYDIDNIPIRNEVKERIKKETLAEMEAIVLIHTLGRMQGLQDEVIQQMIDEVLDKIEEIKDCIKGADGLEQRIAALEEKVA